MHGLVVAVHVAELDLEIGHQRLEVGRAEVGRGARHVPGVGLLDGETPDGPSLLAVGGQQSGARVALHCPRELPGEVVRVVDAGVPSEASVRRHHVRRVAHEEDAAIRVARRDVRARAPTRHSVDPHLEIRHPRRGSHEPDEVILTRVSRGVADIRARRGIAERVHDEKASLAVPVDTEEAAERLVADVDHAQRLAEQLRREIGREVDRHAVREHTASLECDAERLTYGAVRTFGCDEVLRSDVATLAGFRIADRDRDTVGVLHEADDLAPLDHLRPDRLRTLAQDRLESPLRDEEAPAGAQRVVDADVQTGDDVGELLARQRVHADDRAFGEELLLGLRLHLVLDPRSAEELDGAEMEVRGTRQR